jgi:hypothetical protein
MALFARVTALLREPVKSGPEQVHSRLGPSPPHRRQKKILRAASGKSPPEGHFPRYHLPHPSCFFRRLRSFRNDLSGDSPSRR